MKLYSALLTIILITLPTNIMAKWKAGDYMGSGMSKEQYLGKSRSSGYKAPSTTYRKSSSSSSPRISSYSKTPSISTSQLAMLKSMASFSSAAKNAYDTYTNYMLSTNGGTRAAQPIQQGDSFSVDKSGNVTRKKAAEVYKTGNALNGMSFAEASRQANAGNQTIRPNLPGANIGQDTGAGISNSPWRGIVRTGANILKATSPFGGVSQLLNSHGFDLTNLIGMPAYAAGKTYDEPPTGNYTGPNTQNLESGSLTDEQLQRINEERAYNDPNRINQIVNETGGRVSSNETIPRETTSNNQDNRPKSKPISWEDLTQTQQDITNWILGGGLNNPANFQKPTNDVPDNTPNNLPNATITKPLSSGILGNGMGISNMNLTQADQDYIKQLKQSASGDYGMKDAQKQLENLLNSINADYKEQTRIGQNQLNTAKNEDLMKLASLFGAYGTSDSEQRMQQQERTGSDYANKLTELLTQLSAAKNKEILGAKNSALDRFAQINQAKQDAQANVAKMIQDYQDRQWDRQYKMAALNKRGGSSTLKNGSYAIIPGANGEQKYVYNNGYQYVPITAEQYMAGKYGLGIMGNTTPMNPSEMSDEQLNAIINGTF